MQMTLSLWLLHLDQDPENENTCKEQKGPFQRILGAGPAFTLSHRRILGKRTVVWGQPHHNCPL